MKTQSQDLFITRRKALALVAGAGGTLALTACSGSPASSGAASASISASADTSNTTPVVADGLVDIHVTGSTDLPGNFFLSFVYSRNIIMLDGHGSIVWSKHEEQPAPNATTGWWDFKKHEVNGKTYYSYHDEPGTYDNFGFEGFAPGERVILDENFEEVKRIKFEQSDTVEADHPLDGHDFLLIDLDHYIMSGYLHDTVYNVPGYEQGSNVVYSYLQEVRDGKVVWDWRSVDYPELYDLVVTDGDPTANDFGNKQTDVPDIVHFNAMRLNDEGNLVCSFRHLSTILCLDRSKRTDQILWKLSGAGDEFGLSERQKTSCQHYVTVVGNRISTFNNNNREELTGIMSYLIDPKAKKATMVERLDFNGRFSRACGSVQRATEATYVIGWGAATKDLTCMSVVDGAAGEELLSVSIDDPQNFTYRCVYCE